MSENVERKPVMCHMTIDVYLDGTVSVLNFPDNFRQAMGIMAVATAAVAEHFVEQAAAKVVMPKRGPVGNLN